MQDLFQNYVNDVSKMREEFHEELRVSATQLSKAMGDYSRRGEEALTSFMAKVAARGDALEAAAAARFNQFRGLPANGVVSEETVAAMAERAVANGLEDDGDRKLRPPIALVKSGPAA